MLCSPLPHKSRGLCLANTPGLQGPVLMEALKSRVWRGKGNAGLAWETQHLWGPRIGGFIERSSPLLGSPLHGPMLLIFRSITSMQPGSRRDAVHLLAELPSPTWPLCGHHRALADPAECSASQPTCAPHSPSSGLRTCSHQLKKVSFSRAAGQQRPATSHVWP